MFTWNSLKNGVLAALGGLAVLAVLAASPLAAIVGHFHVSATIAAAIMAAITSGRCRHFGPSALTSGARWLLIDLRGAA